MQAKMRTKIGMAGAEQLLISLNIVVSPALFFNDPNSRAAKMLTNSAN